MKATQAALNGTTTVDQVTVAVFFPSPPIPAPVVITSPVDNDAFELGYAPTVSGTGEPGSEVVVTDGSGSTLCTSAVDASGGWSCVTSALPLGSVTLKATQAAPNGTTTVDQVTVTVTGSVVNASVVIVGPIEGAVFGAVALAGSGAFLLARRKRNPANGAMKSEESSNALI
ncbi:Ig-like domain-containing protein [Microbacterium maritypicum]|uniref:Ig-like domain-containing protein n=1 Tax=Microbacterium maritypicum TaxID=33918 RepID=UPI00382D9406